MLTKKLSVKRNSIFDYIIIKDILNDKLNRNITIISIYLNTQITKIRNNNDIIVQLQKIFIDTK